MENFKEITIQPDSFSAANVLQRLIDGVGFRYYWGTDGLTDSDIAYDPGNDNRTMYQTLEHLHYMTTFIRNILTDKPTVFPEPASGLKFSELRAETMNKLNEIKDALASTNDKDFESKKILGVVNGDHMEFNIWQLINGPMLDVGYHLGQVIAFRRANGNPIAAGVEPFFGKKMA